MIVRKYEWNLSKDSIHKNGVIIAGMDNIGPRDLVLDFYEKVQRVLLMKLLITKYALSSQRNDIDN